MEMNTSRRRPADTDLPRIHVHRASVWAWPSSTLPPPRAVHQGATRLPTRTLETTFSGPTLEHLPVENKSGVPEYFLRFVAPCARRRALHASLLAQRADQKQPCTLRTASLAHCTAFLASAKAFSTSFGFGFLSLTTSPSEFDAERTLFSTWQTRRANDNEKGKEGE